MSATPKRTTVRKTYRIEWVKRWTPPKPLVGLQAIEKVLNRHTFLVTPESRLGPVNTSEVHQRRGRS